VSSASMGERTYSCGNQVPPASLIEQMNFNSCAQPCQDLASNISVASCTLSKMLPPGVLQNTERAYVAACRAYDACSVHGVATSRNASLCSAAISTYQLGDSCPAACINFALGASPSNPCTTAEIQVIVADGAMPRYDLSAVLQGLDAQSQQWSSMVSGMCDAGCLQTVAPAVMSKMDSCVSGFGSTMVPNDACMDIVELVANSTCLEMRSLAPMLGAELHTVMVSMVADARICNVCAPLSFSRPWAL
jgi:hypothetical protein